MLGGLVIFGNGWLTYSILRAKKREEFPERFARVSPPATAASRQRQRKRLMVVTPLVGLFAVYMGLKGWYVNSIPAHYVGLFLLGLCGLGVSGVNIWKGGLLDPRHDPRPEAPTPEGTSCTL